MEVIPIPCLKDNYAYLLICRETREAAVVDPSEAAPVMQAIEEHQVQLTAILNTHHHWDHVGGNEALHQAFPGVRIFGHASDQGRIPHQTDFLNEGEALQFGEQHGQITHNLGHTSGAISYIFPESVFTGDTLFAAGCGRLFEGTAEQMHRSLNKQIGSLPDSTKVYFGHEYTLRNLEFSLQVEPGNTTARRKLEDMRKLRESGEFSTPSTLRSERETNPFMRCSSPEIRETVKRQDPHNDLTEVSVLRVLRQLKDEF